MKATGRQSGTLGITTRTLPLVLRHSTDKQFGMAGLATRALPPVLVLALGFVACGGGHEPPPAAQRAAVSAEVAIATTQDVSLETSASGAVQPRSRTSPGTKIMGRVARVHARAGDTVRRGQPLVSLEKRDLEAAVAQARAAVSMAEAQLVSASSQYDRFVGLHERGSATTRNLEEATAAFRIAQASLEQARANLSAAEVTLSYAEIRAAVDGLVVERSTEPGDIASPGVPLMTIDDLSTVKVSIDVPESEAAGLALSAPAEVVVDSLGRTFSAKIDRIVPAVSSGASSVTVEIAIENPDGALQSGMFARARFPRGERSAMLVPPSAIVRNGQLDAVFVVGEQGVARLRWVRLGRQREGGVEVLSGLAAGERYVVDPPPTLVDGSPVDAR